MKTQSTYTINEAFDLLIDALEVYIKLSTAFKIELRKKILMIYYRKGTKLQHFKQIPDQLWFKVYGTSREVWVNENTKKEWVTWFWHANDLLFTEPGIFNEEQADAYIELIDDSLLMYISYSDCVNLKKQFPEVSKLIKKIKGKYARLRKAHQVAISTERIKSRFHQFNEAHPNLINIAKHKDILQYLGSNDDSFRRFL